MYCEVPFTVYIIPHLPVFVNTFFEKKLKNFSAPDRPGTGPPGTARERGQKKITFVINFLRESAFRRIR